MVLTPDEAFSKDDVDRDLLRGNDANFGDESGEEGESGLETRVEGRPNSSSASLVANCNSCIIFLRHALGGYA